MVLITKYILCKWRSYFLCISFNFLRAFQRQDRSCLMAKNYPPPANHISSSKANAFEKYAASVKSLKLEALAEVNVPCWKYKTLVRGSICVIFSYPLYLISSCQNWCLYYYCLMCSKVHFFSMSERASGCYLY